MEQGVAGSLGGPVVVDQPCITCGYSLRGLTPESLCPECATPVDRSLRGDLLVYADPAYVLRLVRGCQMVTASFLLGVGLIIVVIIAPNVGSWNPAFFYPVAGALLLLFLGGWWTLTTPDLGQLTSNRGERPRRLSRAAVSAVGALAALAYALQVLPVPVPRSLDTALTVVSYGAIGFAAYSGMTYLRWLAPRIPNAEAARQAATLMKSLLALIALLLLEYALEASLGPGARRAGVAVSCLHGLTSLWSIVALGGYLRLFDMIRADLKKVVAAQRAGAPGR